MPKSSPAIVSFNAGELSPRLDGRTDLEKYSKGCRTLQNFLPLVQGGITKRLGTLFVLEAPDCRRLVPFVFNSSDAFVLAFYAQAIEFFASSLPVFTSTVVISAVTKANPAVVTANAHGYANGDHVFIDFIPSGMTELGRRRFTISGVTTNTFQLVGVDSTGYGTYTSGGNVSRIYRLTTPFDAGGVDVGALQFAQQNDVVYMACPTHAPMKLSRLAAASWTIAEVAFEAFPFSPENLDEANFMGAVFTGAVTGGADGWSLISSAGEFTSSMVGEYVKIREIPEAYNPEWKAKTDFDGAEYTAFQANGASWENGDRAQYEGRVYELTKAGATDGMTGSVPPSHDDGYASDGALDWRFVNYGYGYGLIKNYVDAFRVDVDMIVEFPRSTITSQLSVTNMTAANPVVVTTSVAHGYESGDKVIFRGGAGTMASAANNILWTITRISSTTFSIPLNGVGLTSSSGFVYRMAVSANANGTVKIYPSLFRWSFGAWGPVRGYPRTVAFFEDRLLWAGTTSNPQTVWASRTGRYEDHAEFQENDAALTFTLSSSDPIEWMRDNNGLVIGTAGSEYSTQRNATEPLSAENANTIRQRSQYGSRRGVAPALVENVILFVQARGLKLRELVFDDTQDGLVASDLTRLADHLTGLGLVKEMAFAGEPFRTLWCVLTTGVLLGFTYERDEQVYAWHRHTFGGTNSKVVSTAVIPHPIGDQDQSWLLVERTIGGVAKRYVERIIGRVPSAGIPVASVLADRFFADSGIRYSGGATAQVPGLVNWAGETFQAAGDGAYLGEYVVPANGSIQLPVLASTIIVGYGIPAVASPMRIEAGSAEGTSQGKLKRISALKIRLQETGRGLYMGPTEASATEEVVIGDTELKTGDTDLLPWPGGWDSDGIIVLRHDKPTPCEITAILPRLTTNDG